MYKTLSAPLVVQVEISSRCPNRCLHCYNYWRKSDEPLPFSDFSYESIKRAMAQLAAHHVFHVVLTGGEPLLNKAVLFRALELAAEHGITAGVNSSLLTLTEGDARRLKELRVSLILTSLMGPTMEVHDTIAQRPGAFTKTLRGIRLLQDAGVPVDVNMVVSQKNKSFVRETAHLVKSLGLPHFSSTRAGCPGNCLDFSELSLDLGEFREYLETLRAVGIEEQMAVGVLESYPLCGMKEVARYKTFTGRHCLAGVTTLTVASDGTVRPCSHLDVHYGNLLMEELSEIWMRMTAWRDGSFLPATCRECKVLPWCGGGCRMEAKMRNGSFDTPDPYMAAEDVEYVFTELTKHAEERRDSVVLPLEVKLSSKLRIRSESFGGVVFLGARFVCYLNTDAFAFLVELKQNVQYSVADLKARFVRSGQEQFLGNLFKRGILI